MTHYHHSSDGHLISLKEEALQSPTNHLPNSDTTMLAS